MDVLRTPDEYFADLPGFACPAHYANLGVPVRRDGHEDTLRIAYIDEGPSDGDVVVLMHGEPTWSFLYRRLIPVLAEAGHRVIAPDLVGFGRSDKPAELTDHTYTGHVAWMGAALFDVLELSHISLVCHDWGGLIGLRLVAEHPDRFTRVLATNTGLPDGQHRMPELWWRFHDFVVRTPDLPVGFLVQSGCHTELAPEVLAAYDAPFPGPEYKMGPRAMPDLIPQSPDHPETPAQQRAWVALAEFDRPFRTAFSNADPVTAGVDELMRPRIPGAAGQPHSRIPGGGHFVQEDCPDELAAVVSSFMGGS
ncbi:MAG: haloalkane dehalogenase [Frankiales bacterium]|jgi:haloalkane dehalogenase|nr:haloalkane dehalogenase [Frankiales bacterium]